MAHLERQSGSGPVLVTLLLLIVLPSEVIDDQSPDAEKNRRYSDYNR
jgi:hypothetical protein